MTSAPASPSDATMGLAHDDDRVSPLNLIPFISIHLICLGVIWVGASWTAVGVAALLYVARMFIITGFYHRYFSHRTFKTSRAVQFLASALGTTTAQRGPIWWASQHRHHHTHSDDAPDVHSPHQHGEFWSHMGWFNSRRGLKTLQERVPDLLKYPELRWMDRWHMLGPIALGLGTFGLGMLLEAVAPALGTNGWQMFVWGFGISTTVLYHGTFTINSVAHRIGSRRFKTKDDSRNNLTLSIITLGEGWHNNHHYFPGTVRQGFYWWEIDPTWWGLWGMSKLGLVSDLRPVPKRVYEAADEHAARRIDPGLRHIAARRLARRKRRRMAS